MTQIFVEKKIKFATENKALLRDINANLNLDLNYLRIIDLYEVKGLDQKTLNQSLKTIFSEPNIDTISFELELGAHPYFVLTALPAQFDIRAHSAEQCIKIINPRTKPIVKYSTIYVFDQEVDNRTLLTIKDMLLNKVEMTERSLTFQESLNLKNDLETVKKVKSFCTFKKDSLDNLSEQTSLSIDDLEVIQHYFLKEKRDPTTAEIAFLATYWSDHCRHSTFNAQLSSLKITSQPLSDEIKESWKLFRTMHNKCNPGRPITLMSLATINAKMLRKEGKLKDVEISDEINAATFFANIEVDGKIEKWLIQFKNETHNHPTEIEPFGGAATCLGGAIRDPLSGRAFVYQGMRISGAGDPFEPFLKTIPNKRSQKQLSQVSAKGFSSYGNQIGIATSLVREIVHPGYRAKRLETGMVVGASPARNVVRAKPKPGDLLLLIGGRTGRDGIGGATGSSKAHNEKSLNTASSEVQKGNAIEERKLQRLYQTPEFAKLVIRSNDLGAGGIATSFGEIAESLVINLDEVPLKYQGLNGSDIALSESQERMAIVIKASNLEKVKNLCDQENVEANLIGKVTNDNRLIIMFNNKKIVDFTRTFLNSNGAKRFADVVIPRFDKTTKIEDETSLQKTFENILTEPNVASQFGLQSQFDSSIGAGAVLAPFGGKYGLSPSQTSVHKIPVRSGKFTNDCSIISYGFDPQLSASCPYSGGKLAVLDSVAKIVAAGGDYQKIHLSLQEYFPRVGKDPEKWGLPFSSLLGAFRAQKELGLGAIGGKDSMSGTFGSINVPPTLISFAIAIENANNVISTDFKQAGNYIYYFEDSSIAQLMLFYKFIHRQIKQKMIVSAMAIGKGGLIAALSKMSFGNKLGFDINISASISQENYGAIVVESTGPLELGEFLGKVTSYWSINHVALNPTPFLKKWMTKYDAIFPSSFKYQTRSNKTLEVASISTKNKAKLMPIKKQVRVLIPVFPGTNCEFDMERQFNRLGSKCNLLVFRNLDEKAIKKSIEKLAIAIKNSDLLVLAGGFSAADEPKGSGKFIISVLQNKKIQTAIQELRKRQGLIIGICNGAQALIKSGLLLKNKIEAMSVDSPTLFKNDSNLHIAKHVITKVVSNKGPWLHGLKYGETHSIAVSHGEGKFIISKDLFRRLSKNGQIAFQYVDNDLKPTMNPWYNPNGSDYAVEGIISGDGLVLAKMGHTERYEENIAKNISGNKQQPIFKNAIKWLKGERNE